MATVKTVEELVNVDRAIIVDALKLKLASIGRAGKSATNPTIKDALFNEGVAIESLIQRFR